MRQVIVDKARHVRAAKRRHLRVTTSWLRENIAAEPIDAELLDGALVRLAEVSPEHARLVELRFGARLAAAIAGVLRGCEGPGALAPWRLAVYERPLDDVVAGLADACR